MTFNKSELYILEHLSFYKRVAIATILASSFLMLFGAYLIVFTCRNNPLDKALTGAAAVVLGCGYLMTCFIQVIEKFKQICQDTNGNDT
jgi:hypothetical protein